MLEPYIVFSNSFIMSIILNQDIVWESFFNKQHLSSAKIFFMITNKFDENQICLKQFSKALEIQGAISDFDLFWTAVLCCINIISTFSGP